MWTSSFIPLSKYMSRPKKSCIFPLTLPYQDFIQKIPTLMFFPPSRLSIIQNMHKTHIFEQKNNQKEFFS